MFCDKDEESVSEHQRHNSIAPNAQNKICNGKSAWEVMREHDDFKNSTYLISSFVSYLK
jgi:calcium-activated chloride channel regulator 4